MEPAVDSKHCPACREPLALTAGDSGSALLRCPRCQINYRLDLGDTSVPSAAIGAAAAGAATQPTIHLGPALESHWQKTLVTGLRPPTPGVGRANGDPQPSATLRPDATILLQPGDRPSLRPTSLPRVQIATAPALTGATDGRAGGSIPGSAPTQPAALEILAKLGAGGMGTVYRARQTALGREVALKQIHAGEANDATVQLFLHEAQATGLLDHPNIVPVHELGIDTQGQVFYTMKLVRGRPWSEFLYPPKAAAAPPTSAATATAAATPLDLAGHLEVLLKVADAVAFAHAKGILHRDLKPDNVMLGDFGEVLVVDWGLACAYRATSVAPGAAVPGGTSGILSVPADLPQAADVSSPCGTPQYLPPEMALGLGRQIGAHSDVYLLGAILYEILQRRPPHQADSVWKVLRVAARNAIDWAPPVAEPARTYFQVLEPLLHRALHSDTAQRFPAAGAFARELRARLRHFDSIALARQAQERLARLATAGAAFAPGTPAATNAYGDFDEALAALRQALSSWPENDLAQREQIAGHAAYARYSLTRGDLALAGAQLAAAQAAAARHPAAIGTENLPDLAARIAAAREETARRAARLKRLQRAVVALAVLFVIGAAFAVLWINHAREQAVAAEQATAQERDKAMAAEQSAATARDEALAAEKRAVAERDRAAATAYIATIGVAARYAYDGNTQRTDQMLDETPPQFRGWEFAWLKAKAHQEIATWRAPADKASNLLAVHPTRPAALVSVLDDHELLLWDAATSKIERRFATGEGRATAAAFNADGSRLIAATSQETVLLWNALTGELLRTIPQKTSYFSYCRFTPDGKYFLADDNKGNLLVGDSPTGRILGTLDFADAALQCFALRADGSELLAGVSTGDLVRYSLPAGEEIGRDHALDEGRFYACAYYDKTTALAVVAEGEMVPWYGVKQINFDDPDTANRFTIETQKLLDAVIADNGQVVAAATYEGILKIWRPDEEARFHLADNAYLRLQGHAGRAGILTIAADGRLVATLGGDGAVKLWNTLGLQSLHFFPGHMGFIHALEPLPGGEGFLTGGMQGRVLLHKYADFTTTELFTTEDEVGLSALAADPHGGFLVTGDALGNIERRDLKTTDVVTHIVKLPTEPLVCQYHPQAVNLLIATKSAVGLWNPTADAADPTAAQPLATLSLPADAVVTAAAFHPAGDLVLAATRERLYAWDWAARQVRWSLPLPDNEALQRIRFSPDGTQFCGAGEAGNLRLWTWSAGAAPAPAVRLPGHSATVADCAFSPDGRRLVSASWDRSLKFWDLTLHRELFNYSAKVYDTTCNAMYNDSDIISYDHACNVDQVLFTPDGRGVLYCKSDGTPVLLQPPGDGVVEFNRAVKAWQADAEPKRLPP